MKFKLVVKGDMDDKLIVTAELGDKIVEGVLVKEKGGVSCPDLAKLLPDPEDSDLNEGTYQLMGGLMDFFAILHGNV